MIHHTFYKGKRVWVILRSGEQFADRYVERRSDSLVFQDKGRIRLRDIRSTTIATPNRKNKA